MRDRSSLREGGGMELGWFVVSSPVQLNPVRVGWEFGSCDLRIERLCGCLGAKASGYLLKTASKLVAGAMSVRV